MKKTYVYDLETLDIFTATFVNKDDDNDIHTFVISSTKNEIDMLFRFLNNNVAALIGYNCIHFDAQILEYLYRNPTATASNIRMYAEIITSSDNRRPDVPEWQLRIPHLDLFRALSLSVKAKRTGLKWCEFMLDMDNIEDMPSQGDGNSWEEKVLSYNMNDVISTKILYQKFYHEIELRKTLTQREGINLLNSTEPDMAKKLFAKYLSKAMNIRETDLRSMHTERNVVAIKDIIFPYISFKSYELNSVKKTFEELIVPEGHSFEYITNYGGISIVYALGGIHGSVNNKIIESTNTHVIKSCDVKSYYPNLAIRNKLHPAHIPQDVFSNLYESLYNERVSIPKKDPRNYILKILLNAVYGMSNDKFSFLKDRQFTLAICINGQLLLSQLFEKMLLYIPDSKLVMCNTDGFEIFIPRQYNELYYSICKEWEEQTKLELEFVDYKKMIISDVNNYLAIDVDRKYKCKGKYEFENIPLHKNKSHSIIPRAVFNYFYNNIKIEDTIYNDRNIFNFCAGVKAKKSEKSGQSRYELYTIRGENINKQRLSKTVRYYISNKGGILYKIYESGDIEHVEAPTKLNSSRTKDWKVTYFNKAFYPDDFEEYNIDYSYYIYKARKWITELEDKQQLKLF